MLNLFYLKTIYRLRCLPLYCDRPIDFTLNLQHFNNMCHLYIHVYYSVDIYYFDIVAPIFRPVLLMYFYIPNILQESVEKVFHI